MNHSVLLSACLMTVTCTGVAVAASPVAYVYVAEEGTPTTTSPISVYAASSAGQLTQIKGSPFTQTSGLMVGTNGTHFITVDQNYTSTNPYLHSYDVSSAGVIGEEVSEVDRIRGAGQTQEQNWITPARMSTCWTPVSAAVVYRVSPSARAVS